jgi:hypothetical protein
MSHHDRHFAADAAQVSVAAILAKAKTPDPAPVLPAAEVIGADTPPAMAALLKREVEFLTGSMWGERDHRTTKAGGWKLQTRTWNDLIQGSGRQGAIGAWGLSRHPVAKHKEGQCIVFGSSVGGERKAKAMAAMYAMALDVDSGAKLDDVIAKVQALGLFAIHYTTFSHLTRGLSLKRDEVMRKLGKTSGTLTDEDVRRFLRDHCKSRYEADFIAAVTIEDERQQTSEGVRVLLSTPPIEKFRVIFPLVSPVKIIDLAARQDDALRIWEDKITGLATKTLGVTFDAACTDPSRLFFTPRHPQGAEFRTVIVQGEPLRFEDVPSVSKAAYTRNRMTGAPFNPFSEAAGDDRRPQVPALLTPEGVDLKDWDRKMRGRWTPVHLLRDLCPDHIRDTGGEGEDKCHCECPFEHEHSKEGGTGFFVLNPEASEHELWVMRCMHDACQERPRLEYLDAMLREGWFDESTLTDPDYLLPAADDELDDDPAKGAAPEGQRASDAAEGGKVPPAGGPVAESVVGPDVEVLVQGAAPFPNPLDPLCDPAFLDKDGWVKGSGDRLKVNTKKVRQQVQERLRERFALVIGGGGRPHVYRAAPPGKVPQSWDKSGFVDFHANRAIPYMAGEKLAKIVPSEEFMSDRDRPTYLGTCFSPAQETVERGQFNLWTGWPDHGRPGSWDLLKGHIYRRMIMPNAATKAERKRLYWWVMMWFADIIQNPQRKPGTAIITRGDEGVGKTLLFEWFLKTLGDYGFKVSNREHIMGKHNDQLDAKLLVLGEESFWAGNQSDAGVLKDLVTAPTITVEPKYKGVEQRPSYIRFAFTSNSDWVCPTTGADARRFLVLDVSNAKKGNIAYFAGIAAQMKAGGLAAMFEELRAFRPEDHGLAWSDLRIAPWTPARAEQATFGLGAQAARLHAIIREGEFEGRNPATQETFAYVLNPDKETLVAKRHLTAVLSEGKTAHGGAGKALTKAIRDLLGANAVSDTKRKVIYRTSLDDDQDSASIEATFVRFPPLETLRQKVFASYR